jgi:hypothetical protein
LIVLICAIVPDRRVIDCLIGRAPKSEDQNGLSWPDFSVFAIIHDRGYVERHRILVDSAPL